MYYLFMLALIMNERGMKECRTQTPLVHNVYKLVVFLADDKMANTSLDLHTFITQNLPKYIFQSSLDYTFLSLSVSPIIF